MSDCQIFNMNSLSAWCWCSLPHRSIQAPAPPIAWPPLSLSPAVSPQPRHCRHYWAKRRPHCKVSVTLNLVTSHQRTKCFNNEKLTKMFTSLCSRCQSSTSMTVAFHVRGTHRERVFPHSEFHSLLLTLGHNTWTFTHSSRAAGNEWAQTNTRTLQLWHAVISSNETWFGYMCCSQLSFYFSKQ